MLVILSKVMQSGRDRSLLRHRGGFTLVELLVIISIISSLSAIAVTAHQRMVKKTHQNTLGYTLNSGARKIAVSTIEGESITADTCLDMAGLSSMNHFQMSCSQRSADQPIYDITAKPKQAIGVGGLLSFDASSGISCWKTCDATGSGETATLSINHLSLDGNCNALSKKVSTYDCNCVTTPVEKCTNNCRVEFYYCCPKHGGPCSDKCRRDKCTRSCSTTNTTTCETCSKTEFLKDS